MSEQEYAISEWPDTKKINADLKKLVSSPMRELTHEYKKQVLQWWDTLVKNLRIWLL
jgi:hypothetical protein